MQSHCVCSCLCAMKWFFLASASEYSQWKCYYKRQQVVSAELMKMCDCSFRNGPTMWLTIPNERIIFTQQLALEWKSHPGRDEDAWNSGKQWEGKGVQRQLTAGEHFLFYLSFPLWAVPLVLLPHLPSTESLRGCIQREDSDFLWGHSSILMQKFIPDQAKGRDGCWTFMHEGPRMSHPSDETNV